MVDGGAGDSAQAMGASETRGEADVIESPVDARPDVPAVDTAGPVAGCLPGLAAPSELAATPRADVNLELLALKLSPGRIVANEAVYQRVVRDVGAIRTAQKQLAGIGFFPVQDGRTITLVVPVAISEQMQAGNYHNWDCLNDTYGASLPFEFIRIGNADNVFVFLKLKGIYAVELLAGEYGRLPGVTSAEGGGIGGDGPTICVTPGDATWHYVFDAAGGDCPAGCTEHAYSHFVTQTDGALTTLETWSGADPTGAPAWVAEYANYAKCH